MIKWPIKYVDYNGEEREEDFYFNLSKAELMEMNFNSDGAYSEFLQRISRDKDIRSIGSEFKRIILKSYGEKSLDGKHFMKRDAEGHSLADQFEQTEAYTELYMELLSDADKASKFVIGIIPKEFQADATKRLKSDPAFQLAD